MTNVEKRAASYTWNPESFSNHADTNRLALAGHMIEKRRDYPLYPPGLDGILYLIGR